MVARAKPDSSYASNFMTRRNAPRKSLLSNFNRPELDDAKIDVATIKKDAVQYRIATKPNIDIDAEPLSTDEEEAESSKPDNAQHGIEKRPEIDIDVERLSSDEEEAEDPMPDIARPSIENKLEIDSDTESLSSAPLSSNEEKMEDQESCAVQSSINELPDIDINAEPLSSDEEQASDSDASPPRKAMNWATKSLETKLAEDSKMAYSSPQSHNGYSRKGGLARTFSAMTDSDEEGPLFSSGSTQSYKRRTAAKYVSKANYFKRPSFVPQSAEKEKEPSPVEGAPKEPEEPEEAFIVPKDIENSSFSHGPYTAEEYEAILLDDGSPLSSPASSTSEQMQNSQVDELASKENRQPSPPLCPMCHREVDRASLELFKAQPKQRIREQMMFCESHKLRSAMDLWRERGYPNIDWKGFEERVQSYFPELEKLLVPGASSYYRNMLSTSTYFAPGKAKNFRVRAGDAEKIETMTCGYYGTLGATRILETIIRRFSVVVRRLATTDELIKTAGVAGYTQSVLVPELAVLMVKDDMKVNDKDARRIMRESMEIGDRVNPDRNVVQVPDAVEV